MIKDEEDPHKDAGDTMKDIGDAAKDARARGLIWAAQRSCTHNDNENVEGEARRGDAEDNRRDGRVNFPKVARKCTTEQQQCKL